jgi:hypothetical protein
MKDKRSSIIFGTARVKYCRDDDRIERIWNIACVIGEDNEQTIRKHLQKWEPGAMFLDVEFIPDEEL